MNREELIKQKNKIQAELDRLTELINKTAERWKPEYGGYYYYLTSNGNVFKVDWRNSDSDDFRFDAGNCFKTGQEAMGYKENLLTRQQLKDLALELNNGNELNWESMSQLKYFIFLNPITHKLDQSWITTYKDIGIYCLDDKFLSIAKERIGEERIIKLIKSGV